MADLFSVQDYRDYLKAIFEERKKSQPLYSYRFWAQQLGLDSAQLYRILSKKMHLPLRSIEILTTHLKLNKLESEVFRLLVQLGRARHEKERRNLVESLLALRDVHKHTLTRDQYLFFGQWYHATVRCLVGALNQQELSEAIAKKIKPSITPQQVQDSLDLQERLGLIRKRQKRYEITDTHLTTSETEVHQAIRQHQAEMLHLGAQALERFRKEDRDFSSLTFAVDYPTALEIGELLKECRRQIQKRIESSKIPDRVLHLSMSLFPTAHVGDQAPWEEVEI